MSDVSVDIIKNRSGEAPDLPSGANLSGVSTAATLQVTNLNPTHINASGVTTATTFSGSLKSTGTPTLGLGVTINSSGINISGVATAGIVSATTLYGDGSNLTGVAMSIAPISYNPDVNDVDIEVQDVGIGITFTQLIKAGSGNVTLRLVGAAGTVVQNFGVGSSVTINQNRVTLNGVPNLEGNTVYHLSYPSGAFTNTGGDVSYVGTAYTFDTRSLQSSLFSVGWDSGGLGGRNTNDVSVSSPIQVPGHWTSLMQSGSESNQANAGIKTGYELFTWGYNNRGNLGLNQGPSQIAYVSSPIQIPGNWLRVAQGREHKMGGIKTDNTLWMWGNNERGDLGQNNNVKYSSPVQVPGTSWEQLSTNTMATMCIRTDNTMWVWGQSTVGILGLSQNGAEYSSPVQLPGTNWKEINIGQTVAMATKTDGTVWTWGSNAYGQMGINDRTQYSSPKQIPGTNWKRVVNGGGESAGVKTDGTLWTWGRNNNGQLGHNSRTDYSSPVQIPGTNWSRVNSTSYHMGAIKTDGTCWMWGTGGQGMLGQNDNVDRSSPVQVPGTTWIDAMPITYATLFLKNA